MSITIHLLRVLKNLKEDNIDAVTFKGVVLAHLAYQNISMRQFGDLDILIQQKDKYKMLKCLLSHGYTPEIVLKEETKKYFFSSVNVLGFYTPDGSTLIEMHWELLSKNYTIPWDENLLWKNTYSTQIYHYTLQTLDRYTTLIYLCIHNAKHLFERLMWLSDIEHWVLNHKNIDWDILIENADNLGVRRIVLLNLTLCHSVLSLPLPQSIKILINKDTMIVKLQANITFTSYSNFYRFKYLWMMRDNYKDKFRFLWLGIFATKFNDFKYLQVPSSLSSLYIFIRPLRLLLKYFR